MGLLGRSIFREILAGAGIGTLLFTFVLFLQRVSLLFEQLVRGGAPAKTVGYLFLLVLPFTMVFTIPVGVLVGVLIGLGRMSSDGEIVALRAAGVSSRRLLIPVMSFALLGTALAAWCSLWLNPLSIRETYSVLNQIAADQMTAEIQPRVFAEQFPNKTIYVGDVVSGPVIRWRNVFIADVTPPGERKHATQESGDAPRITIATEALAVPDSEHNRIQLNLQNGSSHEVGKELEDYFNIYFPQNALLLEAKAPEAQRAKAYTEMDTRPLLEEAKKNRDADIELQRRLSLPPACLLLALVGLPLGASSRKSGKSSAFVLTVFLSFLYFMAQVSLIGLAKQGRLEPYVAAWLPNLLFLLVGVVLILQMESPGDHDWVGVIRAWFGRTFTGLSAQLRQKSARLPRRRAQTAGIRLLPQLIDTYLLSTFLFYFAIMLASFVMMTQVFTFFELLGDILRNDIAMRKVATYHLFLTPKLIYDSAAISAMVAVLVTFGVLVKQNEVTAFKASGVSLHRLAAPILFACLLCSGLLFAFDYYVVPDANLVQDAIRNEIKGRSVRTFLRPDRQWIFGQGSRIFFYKYFDPSEKLMAGTSTSWTRRPSGSSGTSAPSGRSGSRGSGPGFSRTGGRERSTTCESGISAPGRRRRSPRSSRRRTTSSRKRSSTSR
jgi:LPS export ABC transporter permease LptF